MLFISFGCFVQYTPFALSHLNNFETFLQYIVSSQCIELSFLATTLNIFFSEKGTYLSTRTEVVKASHGFKHSVAMRKKPMNTKAVNFLLSACSVEALNFTVRCCSLKLRHNHICEATGFVLSTCESTGFRIQISTCIKTSWHGLTGSLELFSASIHPHN